MKPAPAAQPTPSEPVPGVQPAGRRSAAQSDGNRSGARPSGHRFRRPGRLLALLAALALLGSFLLTAFLDRTLPRLDSYAANASRGLVLLFADGQPPRPADRLLAAGLAEQGIGLTVVSDTADTAAIARQIARLQAETGLDSSRFIYAARSGTVPALLQDLAAVSGQTQTSSQTLPASLPRPGGLLLLAPDGADRLGPDIMAALPGSLPVAVVASASPAAARVAGDLFLWLTGEDATLFPGFSTSQPLAAQTWLSVDGTCRLVLLPALLPLNSGWSPRLHQAAVQAAAEILSANPAAWADTAARLPASSTAVYSRTLLAVLALLLGVAAPLLVILAKSARQNTALVQPGQPMLPEPTWRLLSALEIPLYLPAAVLALPSGHFLASLAALTGMTTASQLVTGFRFYALLGIYGWLYLIASQHHRRPAAAIVRPVATATPAAHPSEGAVRLPGRQQSRSPEDRTDMRATLRATLPGALLAAMLLALAAFWLQAVAGRVLPQVVAALLSGSQQGTLQGALMTVLLAVLLLPALLPFAHGFQYPTRGMPAVTAALHALVPALFLFALRLVENPTDLIAALLAAASGLVVLLAARAFAKSLSAPGVHALVPTLAGLLLLLFLQPLPRF